MTAIIRHRIAELAIIGKYRTFTPMEAAEWEESRQCLANYEWRVARLMNLMLAARIGGDWDWFTELKREYTKFIGR